ncbi:MAG TPA: nuclear transport factor 2 family protein [Vicinamibacterales bacterium]|nr:nuclear transport factor 2 family protein [Vicinamibacterales bacterium]
MTPEQNKKVVQDAYAAFGRGDIPALLATLSADVDWHGVIGVGPKVPQGGPRKGHEEVATFFEQVGGTVDFKRFEPQTFVAEGDVVVVLGFYESVVKPTGKPFASDWVMVFTLRDGKIVKFREFSDSLGITNAY